MLRFIQPLPPPNWLASIPLQSTPSKAYKVSTVNRCPTGWVAKLEVSVYKTCQSPPFRSKDLKRCVHLRLKSAFKGDNMIGTEWRSSAKNNFTGRELTADTLLQMRRADELCFMCCASENDNWQWNWLWQGDESTKLDGWILNLALNYFVFTVNQHNVS